jgi:hypothetical protein
MAHVKLLAADTYLLLAGIESQLTHLQEIDCLTSEKPLDLDLNLDQIENYA